MKEYLPGTLTQFVSVTAVSVDHFQALATYNTSKVKYTTKLGLHAGVNIPPEHESPVVVEEEGEEVLK
jgi:hypothetical protein